MAYTWNQAYETENKPAESLKDSTGDKQEIDSVRPADTLPLQIPSYRHKHQCQQSSTSTPSSHNTFMEVFLL